MVVFVPFAWILGFYLVGSFPTAYILVRLVTGHDIRQMGTTNVGSLNAYRQVGFRGAIPVLLVDAGKGILAVSVPTWLGAPQWLMFVTVISVVVGHNWPVFLNFRGGKGAAAILGISLVLAPMLTLITLASVVFVALITRNVVLGAAFGFVMWNMLLILTGNDPERMVLCVFLTSVVTITYLVSVRDHVLQSIKGHRWRDLFIDLE